MSESNTIIIELGSVRIDLNMDSLMPQQQEVPAVTKSSFVLGAVSYSRSDLEKYKSKNERVKVNTIGVFRLADDITPALALNVMESVHVLGFFQARNDVKDVLMQAGKIL